MEIKICPGFVSTERKKPTLTSSSTSRPGHKTRQNDESLKAPTSVQNRTRSWLSYHNLIFGTYQENGSLVGLSTPEVILQWMMSAKGPLAFTLFFSYLPLIGAFLIMTMTTMKKMTRTMMFTGGCLTKTWPVAPSL